MAVIDWAALVVAVMILVGGAWRIPQLWRDDAPGLRNRPTASPWGAAVWRAFIRAFPTWVPTLVPAVVLYGILIVDPAADKGSLRDQSALMVVLLAVLGAGAATSTAVMLVNRPKFLVPPHLRDQPGMLADVWRTVAKRGRL